MKKYTIDHDFFEYIIAYNISLNEEYTSLIYDKLNTNYMNNIHVKNYINIIFDFFKRNQTVPSTAEIKVFLTTSELKESFIDVLKNFKTIKSEFNFKELLINTEQYLKECNVYHASLNVANQLSIPNNEISSSEILTLFEDACNISLTDDIGYDYFNDIDKLVENLKLRESFIPSGFEWIDRSLGGGFLQSGRALYMFMGPTNSGKSIILGNIAANIAIQNKNVVIISLEMSEILYAKRLSSQITKIPFTQLPSETNKLKQYIIDHKNNYDGNIFIKEYAPKSISTIHIIQYIKKLLLRKKIKKIDVIIIDYLTLLMPKIDQGGLYANGKSVAEEVRALSYIFECPVITAGQMNREGYNDNATITSSGESIGIPQTVDAQINIRRTEEERELGLFTLKLEKSRFGRNWGNKTYRIDFDYLTISENEGIFEDNDSINENENEINRTHTLLDELSE